MAWVKLDDQFPDHRKLAELGAYAPLCGWLYVCGLAYCNRQLTDGVIPKAHIARLAGFEHLSIETSELPGLASFGETIETNAIAELLVQAGLWEDDGRQYRIHDYLHYQPSREAVLQERATVADRKRRWRERHENGVRNSVPDKTGTASGTLNGTAAERGQNAPPVPDPDPDPFRRAVPRGLVAKRNLRAAFEHPRFDVPDWWHLEKVKGLPGGEAEMHRFYDHLMDHVEAHPAERTEPRKKWLTDHFDAWLARTGPPKRSDVPDVDETRRMLAERERMAGR